MEGKPSPTKQKCHSEEQSDEESFKMVSIMHIKILALFAQNDSQYLYFVEEDLCAFPKCLFLN